jgi:hypothetical protein
MHVQVYIDSRASNGSTGNDALEGWKPRCCNGCGEMMELGRKDVYVATGALDVPLGTHPRLLNPLLIIYTRLVSIYKGFVTFLRTCSQFPIFQQTFHYMPNGCHIQMFTSDLIYAQ